MSGRNDTRKNSEPKLGAGAAGAGSGTLLVLLARNLPETNPWKSWLVIVAPSTTVLISALWLWVQHLLLSHSIRRETTRVFQHAKLTLERAMQNPLTSKQHREVLRKRYEELEVLEVDGFSKRLQVLNAESEKVNEVA